MRLDRPFQNEFQLKCHVWDVNHPQTIHQPHSTSMMLPIGAKLCSFDSYESDLPKISSRKPAWKIILNAKGRNLKIDLPFFRIFFFSFAFLLSVFPRISDKRTLLTFAEQRQKKKRGKKRKKEKSSFCELNKFRNLTNRVFFAPSPRLTFVFV